MDALKIILGLLALSLAWTLFYRVGILFRINAWIRERVFSDQLLLFSGRRVAGLLLILGAVALFSGLDGLVDDQAASRAHMRTLLEQARRETEQRNHDGAITRYKLVLRIDRRNVEAWRLLAHAHWAQGEKDEARDAVRTVLRLDPRAKENERFASFARIVLPTDP